MIEKFDDQNGFCMADCMDKINEVIDAVNELQKQYDNVCIWVGEQKLKTPAENVQDKFAEQRKWVGKLCKFWDYDDEEKWFSILEHIDKNSPYTYCASGDWWYEYCEPVKPDDDIIYKGGDND